MSMFSSPSGYSHWLKSTSAYIIPNRHFLNKASTSRWGWGKPNKKPHTQQSNEMEFLEVVAF